MVQNFSMRPLSKFAHAAGILLLVVLLSGCSMARLGYNNGETVSYFWLNGYVDFDADQKPWVKKELASLFAWHRRTQLVDYMPLLAQAKKRVHKPVTEADLARDYEELRRRVLIITDRAAPAAADLALSLRPQQIAAVARFQKSAYATSSTRRERTKARRPSKG
jgi:hypothetical protein